MSRLPAIKPQLPLFHSGDVPPDAKPFHTQLLKWIGNKQRQAADIIRFFPREYDTYYEPFLGSGGVLGVLVPKKGVASDAFLPLMEIWQTLHDDRENLKRQYAKRHALIAKLGKQQAYNKVLASYNQKPNGADFVFLCRACYGGVVRFRQEDGYMSTPVGAHMPVSPESFSRRVDIWHERTQGTRFLHSDFSLVMAKARTGDLVYCDPPYSDTQAILYGAQTFSLERLFEAIAACKQRGAYVALSIDGTKFSGEKLCDVPVPEGLFAREEFVHVGRSMLKRFQMNGKSLESHVVRDRLLLTY